MHMHAEPITEEYASRLLNRTVTMSGRNLFHLVLLEKQVDFVLAADSEWVLHWCFRYYTVYQMYPSIF